MTSQTLTYIDVFNTLRQEMQTLRDAFNHCAARNGVSGLSPQQYILLRTIADANARGETLLAQNVATDFDIDKSTLSRNLKKLMGRDGSKTGVLISSSTHKGRDGKGLYITELGREKIAVYERVAETALRVYEKQNPVFAKALKDAVIEAGQKPEHVSYFDVFNFFRIETNSLRDTFMVCGKKAGVVTEITPQQFILIKMIADAALQKQRITAKRISTALDIGIGAMCHTLARLSGQHKSRTGALITIGASHGQMGKGLGVTTAGMLALSQHQDVAVRALAAYECKSPRFVDACRQRALVAA